MRILQDRVSGRRRESRKAIRLIRKWWWIPLLVLTDIWLINRWTGCSCSCRKPTERDAVREVGPMTISFPTAQTNLHMTDDDSVFMPTESGRMQSALYGSTRTRMSRAGAVPSFHEGIDIGPLKRDKSGRPLDDVCCIADGRVAYANDIAAGSSYGRYVVVEHDDPVGKVYSLYAHLASIADDITQGAAIERGRCVGRMGHSSTVGIPRARAHLHLEMNLMLNRRFDGWLRKNRMDGRHGIHHGWNLTGIDPLALFRTADRQQSFSMADHLSSLAPAFELALRTDRRLDYFDMYPGLWHGDRGATDTAVLSVSEGGVIAAGRPADETERERLGRDKNIVLNVDTEILGRNGRGLITRRKSDWILSAKGRQWIEILTY